MIEEANDPTPPEEEEPDAYDGDPEEEVEPNFEAVETHEEGSTHELGPRK